MIGMMVKIYPKSGEEQPVEGQMKKFASTCVSTEPGTLMYSLTRDQEGTTCTMEVYESADALQAHAATPHHKENVSMLTPLVAKVEMNRFEIFHHPTR